MQISDGKAVQIDYTLRNDAGEVLDSSEGRQPLAYLQGAGNIIPGWKLRWRAREQATRSRRRSRPRRATASGPGAATAAANATTRGP